MAEGTKRLFIAVDPSEECHARITKALEGARPLAPKARWVRADAAHVTLVFVGETPENRVADVVAKVEETARRHAPLTLRFEGAGCFGGRRPRVLFIGVSGDVPALGILQKELSEALVALGHEPEERVFSPHLTLARAGQGAGDSGLLSAGRTLAGETFGEVVVREVVVYESFLSQAGARYEAVARVPLTGT